MELINDKWGQAKELDFEKLVSKHFPVLFSLVFHPTIDQSQTLSSAYFITNLILCPVHTITNLTLSPFQLQMLLKYQRKEYKSCSNNYRQKKSLKKFYRCSNCTIL